MDPHKKEEMCTLLFSRNLLLYATCVSNKKHVEMTKDYKMFIDSMEYL